MMQQPRPPRFASFLLGLFCRNEYLDEVKGDLEETYLWRLKNKGRLRAGTRYYLDVLSAMRLIRFEGGGRNNLSPGMLLSFMKFTFRNFKRNRAYTFFNVFGLALGMAAALLILEYVSDELNYDQFSQADQMYRISKDYEINNERQYRTALTEGTLAAALVNNLPKVEKVARLIDYTWLWEGKNIFTLPDNPEKTFVETRAYFADSDITDLFDLEIVEGRSRLDEPYTVLISEEMSLKYFGDVVSSVGQIIRFSSVKNEPDLLITGVYKLPDFKMQVPPAALVSYNTFTKVIGERGPHNMRGVESSLTYVKLREHTRLSEFEEDLTSVLLKYEPDYKEEKENDLRTGPLLTYLPVRDIHLHSRYGNEVGVIGDANTVKILLVVALLIVIIAWVNYINLATAHSLNRFKELGVRKVMGAKRVEIISQFVVEAFFMNALALMLAVGIVLLGQPFFNQYVHKSLGLATIDLFRFGMPMLIFLLLGVTGSGLYPLTVYLSSGTVAILKGKISVSAGSGLRKGLIVFQFLSGSLLIIATLTINSQLNFMTSKDKGMDMDRVLVLDGPTVKGNNWEQKAQKSVLLTDRLNALTNVSYAGVTTNIPGKRIDRARTMSRENNSESAQEPYNAVYGSEYLKILNLRFIEGTGFNINAKLNETPEGEVKRIREVILSESALKQLGFENAAEAIGMLVYGWTYSGAYPCKVIGVVEDYHHEGLKNQISPMVYFAGNNWDYYYLVKLASDHVAETVEEIESAFEAVHAGSPANYYFLDEFFNRQYRNEEVSSNVFRGFAVVAILIACLGLFGLSSFIALQRTKEIGVRKVLGAGVKSVFLLLSGELILLVFLGFLLAAPLGYYGMNRWLDDFAYHIPVTPALFVVPLLMVVMLALFAIGPRVLKTARMNPVKSLRQE